MVENNEREDQQRVACKLRVPLQAINKGYERRQQVANDRK